MAEQQTIRHPAMAGRFYPGSRDRLANVVDTYFSEPVAAQQPAINPKILIVPHAGYVYSGQTAAVGFAQIQAVSRIILLGGSHHRRFNGAALYQGDFWKTPIGHAPIDQEAISWLEQQPLFDIGNDVHQPEHCLEVQVPFLQQKLSHFGIVPILLSQASKDEINQMARVLVEIMDDDTLLVISSDLSHYPPQDDAKRIDQAVIEAILSLDIDRLAITINQQMNSGVDNLSTCACAETAIKVGMQAAHLLGATDVTLLRYTNSGQISGDPARVVGYATIAFC
jgi:MEMO1 family protein